MTLHTAEVREVDSNSHISEFMHGARVFFPKSISKTELIAKICNKNRQKAVKIHGKRSPRFFHHIVELTFI